MVKRERISAAILFFFTLAVIFALAKAFADRHAELEQKRGVLKARCLRSHCGHGTPVPYEDFLAIKCECRDNQPVPPND